jgi:hypothetical protein
MLVRPGPSIEPSLLDVAQITPAQLPRHHGATNTGARALLVRLLVTALVEAGWSIDGRTGWHHMPAHSGA